MKINWGAILLAAIVHFGFGAVWFTAFSKPWQAGTRMSPEEITNFEEFWPYYVGDHKEKATRILHFVGTTVEHLAAYQHSCTHAGGAFFILCPD